MPSRFLRPCGYPGCVNTVRDGRYCQAHEQQVAQIYDAERGSAARRGYGARWRRLRAVYLREHPLCVDPFGLHTTRVVVATQVDHIVPRREGGGDEYENLQALCESCHSHKTRLEVNARKRGRVNVGG